MKKLFRVTTIPLSSNLLLKNQLRYLNQFFDVTVVSSPGEDLKKVQDRERVKIVALEMTREINIIKDIVSITLFLMLFRKEKPYIVHSNTPKSSLLSMMSSWMLNIPCRIYTVTGLRFETETGLKRSILIWMEKLTCYCATHVIAESKGVQKMIIENELTKKSTYILGNGNINGIDEKFWDNSQVSLLAKCALRKQLNINETDFIFLFVGRLTSNKGVNELIQSFMDLNMSFTKLLLVGQLEDSLDPLNSDTIKAINNNNAIIKVGFQDDVRLFMSISNVLVLPSYREGFPNVILQAGAMELPCIVTKVNGAEEVIDYLNGILVEKKDINSLTNSMKYIVKNYDSYDKQYCRNKVIRYFSQKYYFPELLKFYQKII